MFRIVLDTNVIISAIISSQSAPAKILDFWKEDKFAIITSPEIMEEVAEVIFRPIIKKHRKISDEEAIELLAELQENSIYITPVSKVKFVKDDPADDKFVHAAIDGKADYLISGDKHLLKLHSVKKCQIVTPQNFVEILVED